MCCDVWCVGIALRYIYDALRKQDDSKMFRFGMWALEQFKARLPLWPQYCQLLGQIPHLRAAHPDLITFLEACVAQSAGKETAESKQIIHTVLAPQHPTLAAAIAMAQKEAEAAAADNHALGDNEPYVIPCSILLPSSSVFLCLILHLSVRSGLDEVPGGAPHAPQTEGGATDEAMSMPHLPSYDGFAIEGVPGSGSAAAAAGGEDEGKPGVAPKHKPPLHPSTPSRSKSPPSSATAASSKPPVTPSKPAASAAGSAAGATSAPPSPGPGASPAPKKKPASNAPSTASFGITLNIDTLINAESKQPTVPAPAEQVTDKLAFIVNNISRVNLKTKGKELKQVLKPEFYPHFARYFVIKRVSIEANFHKLYASFLGMCCLDPHCLSSTAHMHVLLVFCRCCGLAQTQERGGGCDVRQHQTASAE